MQLTSYHSQTVTRICAHCGAPFIGHPRREYCSGRCKRRAREHRYKLPTTVTNPQAFYEQEYEIVEPEYAHSIFKWMNTSGTEAVSIKVFTDPDNTIIPPTLEAQYNGNFFSVIKLHTAEKSDPLTITAELERTTPHYSPDAQITFVPPPNNLTAAGRAKLDAAFTTNLKELPKEELATFNLPDGTRKEKLTDTELRQFCMEHSYNLTDNGRKITDENGKEVTTITYSTT